VGGARGEARAARERRGKGARAGDGAAPRAHFDSAPWGRISGARAAWRAVILPGRSLRLHGAVAKSGVFFYTADLVMGAAFVGWHPPI